MKDLKFSIPIKNLAQSHRPWQVAIAQEGEGLGKVLPSRALGITQLRRDKMKTQNKDSLGNRMKEYEEISATKLPRRLPVIIRIDGKAFHTYTRGMDKPFDTDLAYAMKNTTRKLCEEISGAKIGYTQSDEITIVVTNDDTLTTDAWFDNKVQKLVSVASSIATAEFNKLMNYWAPFKHREKTAYFDARAFVVPSVTEAGNNLYWRQLDATRNSIQMVGQSLFTHKELQGVSNKELQNKMLTERDVNWNNLPTWQKRGTCVVRGEDGLWVIDEDIPVFNQDWTYITDRLTHVDQKGDD